VRVLALEVAEERLDPGLVVRGAGAAEVLGDARPGQERRVEREVICGPLSDRASSTGSSSRSGTSPWASSSSSCASSRWALPSTISARVNATSTWVEDSWAETTVDSQYRDTTSRTATTARRATRKWVKS
jgi:hypothetical protein